MNIRLATKQESKDNVIGTSRIGYVDSSFGNLKTLLGFPNVIDATSGGSNIALDPSVLTNSVDNKVHFEWHVIVNHGDLLKEFFMTIYGYKLFDAYGKARSIDESIDYGWSIGMNTFDHDDISVEFQEEITSIIKDALTFPHKVNDADVTFRQEGISGVEIDELKNEWEIVIHNAETLQNENKTLKAEIKELKEWNDNLEKTAVNQYSEIQELKKENKELKVEKQSMVIRNLKRLKKELKETSSYWKNIKENEVAIKQAEIKELKKENEELHKGWKITEIEKIRKENEELYKK
jgi:FtsZ-binding cell division protein ZapB